MFVVLRNWLHLRISSCVTWHVVFKNFKKEKKNCYEFFEVFNDRLGRKLSSYVTWHNVQTSNKKCPLSNFQTLNMCLMIDLNSADFDKSIQESKKCICYKLHLNCNLYSIFHSCVIIILSYNSFPMLFMTWYLLGKRGGGEDAALT